MVDIHNTQINYRDNRSTGFFGQLLQGIACCSTGYGAGYGIGSGGFNTCGGWSGSLYGYGFGGGYSVESQCGEIFGGVITRMAGIGIQQFCTHQSQKQEALTAADTAAKTVDNLRKELEDIKKKPLSDYEAKAKEDAGVKAAYEVYTKADAELKATAKPDSTATDEVKRYNEKKAAVTNAEKAYKEALNKKAEELKQNEIEAKQKEIDEAIKKQEEAAKDIANTKRKCNEQKEYEKLKNKENPKAKDRVATFMYEFHQFCYLSDTVEAGEKESPKKKMAKAAIESYDGIIRNAPQYLTPDIEIKIRILNNYINGEKKPGIEAQA